MNPQQFNQQFATQIKQIETYIRDGFPRAARNIILRSIDGNFRAQGFAGVPWLKNKKGTTILIKTGNLRRSIHSAIAPGEVKIFTNAPYAAVHNRGFSGKVTIKGYTRNYYTEQRIGTGRFNKNGTERTKKVHVHTGSSQVKTHTRKINMPKRQFMPETQADDPALIKTIENEAIQSIKSIFP